MNSIVLKQELKKNFKDYRSLTKKQRAFLNDIGCTVSRQKKHLVLAVPVIRYEKNTHLLQSLVPVPIGDVV